MTYTPKVQIHVGCKYKLETVKVEKRSGVHVSLGKGGESARQGEGVGASRAIGRTPGKRGFRKPRGGSVSRKRE